VSGETVRRARRSGERNSFDFIELSWSALAFRLALGNGASLPIFELMMRPMNPLE